MKNKKILLIVFVSILLMQISLASAAAAVEIEPLYDIYNSGDSVDLSATVTNNFDIEKTFIIEQGLIQPEIAPYPVVEEVTLPSGGSITVWGLSFTVGNITDSGEYTYYVKVLENDVEIEKAEATFEVIGTLKTFDNLDSRFCEDSSCNILRGAFLINESPIYIKVFDFEGARLEGKRTNPEGSVKELRFENDISEIDFNLAGEYIVEITASKEGYQTATFEKEFTIIEKLNEVIAEGACNSDDICDEIENYANCPQDCSSGSEDGYCDKVIDGKCDADCEAEEDADCMPSALKGVEREAMPFLQIIIAAAVIAAVVLAALMIITRLSRRKFKPASAIST